MPGKGGGTKVESVFPYRLAEKDVIDDLRTFDISYLNKSGAIVDELEGAVTIRLPRNETAVQVYKDVVPCAVGDIIFGSQHQTFYQDSQTTIRSQEHSLFSFNHEVHRRNSNRLGACCHLYSPPRRRT